MLHDHDAVRDLRHHAEIVSDEEHAHVSRSLHLTDQRQDLCLCGDIKSGRRLVRNQYVGLEHQCHRDHRALALSAGHLVRIRAVDRLRVGQMNRGEHVEHALAARFACPRLMHLDRLLDLPSDGQQRVQRCHRFLENHREAAAAQLAQPLLFSGEQVLAFEENAASTRTHVSGGKEPQHGTRHHRFTRARFTDDAEDLVASERDRHVLHCMRALRPRGQIDRQVLDREHRFGGLRSDRTIRGAPAHAVRKRGLSASFSPSPTRLIAITVTRIAIPGIVQTHHAERSTVRPAPMM